VWWTDSVKMAAANIFFVVVMMCPFYRCGLFIDNTIKVV